MEHVYYVYIMGSFSGCLYIGVTNDLVRRVGEHRGLLPQDRLKARSRGSFARRYRTRRLVYLEVTTDIRAAIAREDQLKSWGRARKQRLIARFNPGWADLAARWPEITLPE